MNHAEVLDRLEASLLEPGGVAALDADRSAEAGAIRSHLAACQECAAEHRAWQLADLIMAQNVPDTLAAPAGARERVLSAVALTGAPRPLGGSLGSPVPAPMVATSRAATPRPAMLTIAAAFAAALFLAGAVLGGPLGLVSREADTSVADARVAAVAAAVDRVLQSPERRLVQLVDAAGSGAGSVLFDPDSRELVVVSRSLQPLPEGREYVCFLEREGKRIRVGRLRVVGDAAYWMGPLDEPPDAGRSGDLFLVIRDDQPEMPVLSGGF